MQRIKKRLLPVLLCAAAVSFTLFVFGPVDIFAGNRVEFTFAVSDFIWPMLLIALGLTAVLSAVLLLLPDKAYRVVLTLLTGASVMGVVQSWFLNRGASSLPSGDMVAQIGVPNLIVSTVVWLTVLGFCVFAVQKDKWKDTADTVAVVLLVVLVGMGVVGLVSDLIAAQAPAEGSAEGSAEAQVEPGVNYLSYDGLATVAPGKNVIVFILDRFDVQYHDDVEASDPAFFTPLSGFTYFSDNISYFTATYPSIVHMITDTKQDFTESANDYFNKAYRDSTFLSDLRDNDYAIRLYTGSYYAYRDGTSSLRTFVENAAVTGSYVVTDRGELVRQMTLLSAYRYAPSLVKLCFPESWFSFGTVTDVPDTGESVYVLDDVKFCETIAGGLTLQTSAQENAYIFYHLTGCHPPLYMDETGARVEKATTVQSCKGCFNMIFAYIDELKRLGLYEDATIIITGDHSQGFSDVEGAAPVNGTALFVKPAGRADEPLTTSTAQVSDENLFAAIVKSAGIATTHDYGRGYFDIPEGETVSRYMVRFEEAKRGIHFTVEGPWVDKTNWTETSRDQFDDFYR